MNHFARPWPFRAILSVVIGLGLSVNAAWSQDLDASSLSLASGPALSLGSFGINIVPGAGLSANTAALAAFNRAAAQWTRYLGDPITINISADLAALGAGILGSTNSVTLAGSASVIRNAIVSDAANETDDAVVAFMPVTPSFTLKSGVSLSGSINVSKANAKALGFTGLDTAFGSNDATITFSSNFSFDYDNSDGVTLGTYDFETVAAHEIGHVLGFFSSVDEVVGGATVISPSTLDLFRFADNVAGSDPTTTSDFSTATRNLVPGTNDIFDDLTHEWAMSTGSDGHQASHWKDDGITGNFIGLMDPTLAPGVIERVAYSDLRALDVIGYEIDMSSFGVPEPCTAGTAMLLLGVCGTVRRRRRAAAVEE